MKSAEEHVKTLGSKWLLEDWKKELDSRILKLACSSKCRETFADALLKQLGAKLLYPKRMSLLSMEEEEARVKASWMQWDCAMYVAAFGNHEVLSKFVADPESFACWPPELDNWNE